MKMFWYLAISVWLGSSAMAADSPLAAANRSLLRGRYAEAVEALSPLAKQDAAAAVALARAYSAQGKLGEAAATLRAAPAEAIVLAEQARMAFDRGDYDAAQTAADKAVKLDRNQALARFIAAELHRVAGRLDEADRGYRALVRLYNEQTIEDAESLRWIGRAAAQNARWNRLSDQFDFLVNDLLPSALKFEPDYWPAHFEAGLLFMEKYNAGDAAREFAAALKLNPNAAEVHAALAALALIGNDTAGARRALDRAIEICPASLDAWQLRADVCWANFQPDAALKLLQEKALPLNRVNEGTLARVAACYLLLDGDTAGAAESRFGRLLAEVTKRNPRPGEFHAELADLLEARNKQAEAEKYYRKAIETMPRLVGPQADLGLLLMRTPREDEARKLLDEAFRADPFHVRVHNMLEVLDVLAEMKTTETEHFVLRFDGARDALLARYAARRLEQTHPRLAKLFGYAPPGKSLFEVFSEAKGRDGHAWFSARMTGLPYVGTVAASTGRIVAMTSPGEAGHEPFNWARVMTHEYVHVVTLQQTDFNIPHWYTEGLAVWCENAPRPRRWVEALRGRARAKKLFTLDDINFGFQRPKSGEDWALAYCQAELYVELMLKLGGEPALRDLLAAYAKGQTTPQAIQQVFGIGQAEFERKYAEMLEPMVASPRLARPSGRDLTELLDARREKPDDVATMAELADAHLARGAADKSRELVNRVLATDADHPLAICVAARLRLRELAAAHGDDGRDVAREDLEAVAAPLEECYEKQPPHEGVMTLLGMLRLKLGDHQGAVAVFERAGQLDPDDPRWPRALVRTYVLMKDEDKLVGAMESVARLDVDDFAVRKKLAQIAAKEKDFAKAARWAEEAIDINVADAEVHRLLGRARAALRQSAAAIEEFAVALDLEPDDNEARFGLAESLAAAGERAKARSALEELLKRTPGHKEAAALLKQLEDQ